MENNIIKELHYFFKLFRESNDSNLAHLGIPPSHCKLLVSLLKHGKITQKEVTEVVLLKAPTISLTIKEMMANDLLIQEPDSEDRRKNYLVLTSKGHNLALEVDSIISSFEKKIIEELSEDDINKFSSILDKLITGVKK